MQPQPDWPRTLDEFRAWHERQPDVWEVIHGAPKLMTPGSKAHTVIKSNVGRLPGNALDQTGCRALVDGAIVAPPDPLRLDPPGVELPLHAIYDGLPLP